MSRKTAIWHLLIFIFCALFGAQYLLRLFATRGDVRSEVDSSQISSLVAGLKSQNPDYIMIGDSMLDTRVDEALISKISGRRFFLYCRGGTSTAAWYLYLKNVIVKSGVKPKAIIFLFRNQYLTWPRFRVDDMYKANLDRLKVGVDPLVTELIYPQPSKWKQPVAWTRNVLFGPNGIYFSKTAAAQFHTKIENLALDLTSLGQKKDDRKVYMGKRFSLASLRPDLATEATGETVVSDNSYDARPRIFDPSPNKSFLPHIVSLGRDNGIPLVFFRVKCRPDRDNITPQTEEMVEYIYNLQAWMLEQKCLYFDETKDTSITLPMYQDGDHISIESKPWWTSYFWQRMEPILP